MVFSCFWGIPEKKAEKARKHYKNSGFVVFFQYCFEGRFREKRLGREFGPRTRGIWERKTPPIPQLKFPIFTLAEMLGSAAGRVEGTKSPPWGGQDSPPTAEI